VPQAVIAHEDAGVDGDGGDPDAAVVLPDAAELPDAGGGDDAGAVLPDAAEPPDAGAPDTGCPGGGEPSVELCDGDDDDCDDIEDDGCPTGPVVYGLPRVYGGYAGSVRGDLWTSGTCPADQVIIGAHGRDGAYIDSIGEYCGILSVVEDRSVVPYRYALDISAGDTVPARGGAGGDLFDFHCDRGEVVTGLRGRAGSLIERLSFTCSRFDVVASARDGFLIEEIGQRREDMFTAGSSNNGAPFDLGCPVGSAGIMLTGANDYFSTNLGQLDLVAGIGLECISLKVEIR
jgi:hypothetical protein